MQLSRLSGSEGHCLDRNSKESPLGQRANRGEIDARIQHFWESVTEETEHTVRVPVDGLGVVAVHKNVISHRNTVFLK